MICWAIWQRRNKMRMNKVVDNIENTGAYARGYLEEFSQSQSQSHSTPSPSPSPRPPHKPIARWMRPSTCKFKVNYDGDVFNNSYEAGIEVVIWDTNGLATATLSQKIRYPHSVEATEALVA